MNLVDLAGLYAVEISLRKCLIKKTNQPILGVIQREQIKVKCTLDNLWIPPNTNKVREKIWEGIRDSESFIGQLFLFSGILF